MRGLTDEEFDLLSIAVGEIKRAPVANWQRLVNRGLLSWDTPENGKRFVNLTPLGRIALACYAASRVTV